MFAKADAGSLRAHKALMLLMKTPEDMHVDMSVHMARQIADLMHYCYIWDDDFAAAIAAAHVLYESDVSADMDASA